MICPACGEELRTDETLWTWREQWYCSEKCVRQAQVSVWGPRR